LGTAEPLELMAGDLNVVREVSEGICRHLQTVLCCASRYCRCDDVDHCAEVQESEGLSFPCVPLAGISHMVLYRVWLLGRIEDKLCQWPGTGQCVVLSGISI